MGCTASKRQPSKGTKPTESEIKSKAPVTSAIVASDVKTETNKVVEKQVVKRKQPKMLPPPLLPPNEDTVSRQASIGDSNTLMTTNAAVKDTTTDLLTPCSFHFNETFPPNSPSVGSRTNSECVRQLSTVS